MAINMLRKENDKILFWNDRMRKIYKIFDKSHWMEILNIRKNIFNNLI